jgi:hypothetical protein
MQGVDRTDQLMHSYDCTRKAYSWFKKLGLHFLQRAVLNAHHVFLRVTALTGSRMSLLSFIMNVVEYMSEGLTEHLQQVILVTNIVVYTPEF